MKKKKEIRRARSWEYWDGVLVYLPFIPLRKVGSAASRSNTPAYTSKQRTWRIDFIQQWRLLLVFIKYRSVLGSETKLELTLRMLPSSVRRPGRACDKKTLHGIVFLCEFEIRIKINLLHYFFKKNGSNLFIMNTSLSKRI